MEKKVFVLGAGLVAKPLVTYLLDHGFAVTAATRTVSKAEAIVGDHPLGEARSLDVTDDDALGRAVSGADLVVSLVPYTHHVRVAKLAVAAGTQMVTTSYVSPAMRELDGAARDAGVLLLNEIGLDPGIDHMSAMRVIHGIQGRGGRLDSFRSYCGGLPAPEANDNPFGYKFSWSPRGVVLAARNAARYLEDTRLVEIPGPELFDHHWPVRVQGMEFEAYPNRDSMQYIDTYGLAGIKTMFRGTLRNPGWCVSWKKMADLGLLEDARRDDLPGMTYGGLLSSLAVGAGGDPHEKVASHLGIAIDSEPMQWMSWLGLFEQDPIPEGTETVLDALVHLLFEKLQYAPGERDMIVLYHEFGAVFPDGRSEQSTSTLVDYGLPGGYSAMSRTVGLPAAIAARMILEGTIKQTGVHVPVIPKIYDPVLDELEAQGIRFEEKTDSAD